MRSINVWAAVLAISGLVAASSPSMILADEPPAQNSPSTGAPEPASPATAPTMPDEPAPPAEATDIQERGVLPGAAVAPGANLPGTTPLQFSAPTANEKFQLVVYGLASPVMIQ